MIGAGSDSWNGPVSIHFIWTKMRQLLRFHPVISSNMLHPCANTISATNTGERLEEYVSLSDIRQVLLPSRRSAPAHYVLNRHTLYRRRGHDRNNSTTCDNATEITMRSNEAVSYAVPLWSQIEAIIQGPWRGYMSYFLVVFFKWVIQLTGISGCY